MAYDVLPIRRTGLPTILDIELGDEPICRIEGDKLLLKRG